METIPFTFIASKMSLTPYNGIMSHDNSAPDNNRENLRTFPENYALDIALLNLKWCKTGKTSGGHCSPKFAVFGFCGFFPFLLPKNHSHSFLLTSFFAELKREYKSLDDLPVEKIMFGEHTETNSE